MASYQFAIPGSMQQVRRTGTYTGTYTGRLRLLLATHMPNLDEGLSEIGDDLDNTEPDPVKKILMEKSKNLNTQLAYTIHNNMTEIEFKAGLSDCTLAQWSL